MWERLQPRSGLKALLQTSSQCFPTCTLDKILRFPHYLVSKGGTIRDVIF
jgi:hypothetical protein